MKYPKGHPVYDDDVLSRVQSHLEKLGQPMNPIGSNRQAAVVHFEGQLSMLVKQEGTR